MGSCWGTNSILEVDMDIRTLDAGVTIVCPAVTYQFLQPSRDQEANTAFKALLLDSVK